MDDQISWQQPNRCSSKLFIKKNHNRFAAPVNSEKLNPSIHLVDTVSTDF